jgi:hypothetical protein
MTKKHISLLNSVDKNCDKLSDGNIKPEVRERILITLREYLEDTGRANISEISKMLKLSRHTTKNLISEILAEWHEEIQDQTLIHSKWIESVLRDIDQNPDTLSKEKITVVKLKSFLLSKFNALQKFALKEDKNISIFIVKNDQSKKLPDDKPP